MLARNDAQKYAFLHIVMADYVLIHFRPYLGQTCQNIHKRVPLVGLLAIDRVEGSGRTVRILSP